MKGSWLAAARRIQDRHAEQFAEDSVRMAAGGDPPATTPAEQRAMDPQFRAAVRSEGIAKGLRGRRLDYYVRERINGATPAWALLRAKSWA